MWVPLVFLFIITCHSSASLGVHPEGDAGYRTHFRSPSRFGEQARDWMKTVKDRFMGWVLRIVTPNMPRFDVDFRDYIYPDPNYNYPKQTQKIPDPCVWNKLPADEEEPKRSTFIGDWSYGVGSVPEVTKPVSIETTTEPSYYDVRKDTNYDLMPPPTTPTIFTTRSEEARTMVFDTTTPPRSRDQPSTLVESTSSPTTAFASETKSTPGITAPPASDRTSVDSLEPEVTMSTAQMQTTKSSTPSKLDPESFSTFESVPTTEPYTSTNLEPESHTTTKEEELLDESTLTNLEPKSFTTTVSSRTMEQSSSINLDPDLIKTTVQAQTTEQLTGENMEPQPLLSTTEEMQPKSSSTINNVEPELSPSTTENVDSELLPSTTENVSKHAIETMVPKATPTSSSPGNTQYPPITLMTESTSYSPTEETVTSNNTPSVTGIVADYDSDVNPNSLETTTHAIIDLAADDEHQNVGSEMTDLPNTQTEISTSEDTNGISITDEPQSLSITPTANDVINDVTSQTTNLPPTTTPIPYTTKKVKVEDNEVYRRRTSRKPPRPSSVEVLLPY